MTCPAKTVYFVTIIYWHSTVFDPSSIKIVNIQEKEKEKSCLGSVDI